MLIALLANFALSLLLHSINDLFENLLEFTLIQICLCAAIWFLIDPDLLPRPSYLSLFLLAPAAIEFALSHTGTTLLQRWGLAACSLTPAILYIMAKIP